MDLRIVNTCNNDCLYCLEGNLRKLNQKYTDKEIIYKEIIKSNDNKVTFYGGNPLMHPDLFDIINKFKLSNYSQIGLLTNSSLLENKITKLLESGLTDIGVYFNSFDRNKHNLLTGGGINYGELLKNLKLLSKTRLNLKVIIHINNVNIDNVCKDIFLLNKLYGIINFDFVNYFPFDKPYLNKDKLEYDILQNRENIDLFFKVIDKLNLNVFFSKFPKKFFGNYTKYYNINSGVINQIGKEDLLRISNNKKPFCFKENRCEHCFISDVCEVIKNNK